ncbi:ImmA/IrrE family metallo-endopeptidase [Clostridium sp.]|uniref:ImmA/IrrE family metallo-endopeptidase n=1 Tax=Clostridium sp. TaxID=1506 RepID=UPI0025B95886|nr:ImmA/IrrE family metallo-endopeptidase [Clostridium sp.]
MCPLLYTNTNITLIIEPLGKPLGMYKFLNKNHVIWLNSSMDENARRFVLAHEIAHAILHTKSSCFFSNVKSINISRKEYEANIFAAELLLDLSKNDISYIDGYSIDQLASCYKVPVELVKLKYKLISES